eukprot:141083_1
MSRVLQHVVFLKLSSECTDQDVDAFNRQMERIVASIDGMLCGSITKNEYSTRTKGYTHQNVSLFSTVEGLNIYADHPEHVKLKKMVGKFMTGDLNNNLAVIDSWTTAINPHIFRSKL